MRRHLDLTRHKGAPTGRALRASVRASLLAAGLAVGVAGCLDLALVADVAFPARLDGLPPEQPWVPFPVKAWTTEREVEALALAGCFAPGCEPGAAVGLFRARGAEAETLARIVEQPDRLVQRLTQRPTSRTPKGRAAVPVVASSERLQEGSARGFVLRLARPDGSRPAVGIVLSAKRERTLTVLLVVTPSEDAARRLARDLARNV